MNAIDPIYSRSLWKNELSEAIPLSISCLAKLEKLLVFYFLPLLNFLVFFLWIFHLMIGFYSFFNFSAREKQEKISFCFKCKITDSISIHPLFFNQISKNIHLPIFLYPHCSSYFYWFSFSFYFCGKLKWGNENTNQSGSFIGTTWEERYLMFSTSYPI